MNSESVHYCNYIKKLLRQDWDHWTVYVGDEGVGKSTRAIWDAHNISGPLFRISEHICYDPMEFLTMVDNAPRYGTILLDEAAELWYNRDFATKANKALAKASTQIRDRNLNIVLCLPELTMLDGAGIRRHKLMVRVSAPAGVRGRSEYFIPHFKKFGKPGLPYWEKQFTDFFPRLPEKVENKYKAVKTARSIERMDDYINTLAPIEKNVFDPETIAAQILDDPKKYYSPKGALTIASIAANTGLSHSRAYRIYAIVKDNTDEGAARQII